MMYDGAVLALIGNFDFTEVVVVAATSLILFGKRLPEVAMRAATQFMKVRRAVTKMWREAGLEDELRRVKREVDSANLPKFTSPQKAVKDATRRYMQDLERDVEAPVVSGEHENDTAAGQHPKPALEDEQRGAIGNEAGTDGSSDSEQDFRGPDPEPPPPSTGTNGAPDFEPRPIPHGALDVDDRREDASNIGGGSDAQAEPASDDEGPGPTSVDDRERA
ncbi:MAG: Sec-independent protein translocase protein TatA [Planctomycetota bacterium]|jgi:Sec-independent protein translocase protein TatA